MAACSFFQASHLWMCVFTQKTCVCRCEEDPWKINIRYFKDPWYFSPLVFWYQWDYLRSPAKNFFLAGYLRL